MTHSNTVRVRYVDCDMQGVVYNAHYLTYIDDAFDCWIREYDWNFEKKLEVEVMLKSVQIVWHSPARFGDVLKLESQVTRWGNSSFDITSSGYVTEEKKFDSTISYVCVDSTSFKPTQVPDLLKCHLENYQEEK